MKLQAIGTTMSLSDELISVPEAARRAGVARNTMRLAAKNGAIRAMKPGRNWLIYADDIERWKQQQYNSNMSRSSDADLSGASDEGES